MTILTFIGLIILVVLAGILTLIFREDVGKLISKKPIVTEKEEVVTITTEEKKKDTPVTENTKKVEEVKKIEPEKKVQVFKINKYALLCVLLILMMATLYVSSAHLETAPWYYGWSGGIYFWPSLAMILVSICLFSLGQHWVYWLIGIIFLGLTVVLFTLTVERRFKVKKGDQLVIDVPKPFQRSDFRAITNGEPSYEIRYNDQTIWYEKYDSVKSDWQKLHKITIRVHEDGEIIQEFRYSPPKD